MDFASLNKETTRTLTYTHVYPHTNIYIYSVCECMRMPNIMTLIVFTCYLFTKFAIGTIHFLNKICRIQTLQISDT